MQIITITICIGLQWILVTGKVTGQELMLTGQVVEMLLGIIHLPLMTDTLRDSLQDVGVVIMAQVAIGHLTKYQIKGMLMSTIHMQIFTT